MIPRYQRSPLDPSGIEVIFARSCDIEIRLLRKLFLSLGGKNKGEYARLQRWRWHLPGVSFNMFQSIKKLAVQDTNVKDIFEQLGIAEAILTGFSIAWLLDSLLQLNMYRLSSHRVSNFFKHWVSMSWPEQPVEHRLFRQQVGTWYLFRIVCLNRHVDWNKLFLGWSIQNDSQLSYIIVQYTLQKLSRRMRYPKNCKGVVVYASTSRYCLRYSYTWRA